MRENTAMWVRRTGVALAATVSAVAFASPAWAEGSWRSSLRGVMEGYGSRTWVDKNTDSYKGRVAFYGCSGTQTSRHVKVAVYRNRQWPVPDVNVKQGNTCSNTTLYYGDVQRGDYHFSIKDLYGRYSLNANTVIVRY